MKDFPMFTTEYGVASLVLKEIPYQDAAYVILRDTLDPEHLTSECASFCRMCGAEAVYATGHAWLERYPLYTVILEMQSMREALPDTDAALFPVQERTLDTWRGIYNEKVRRVPSGAWMTEKDAQEMLRKGEGYFIHRGEELLGIGKVSSETIEWVASVRPGAGRDVVAALAHAITGEVVTLTVAGSNKKAVRLYESLGFIPVYEISRWYKVF